MMMMNSLGHRSKTTLQRCLVDARESLTLRLLMQIARVTVRDHLSA